MSPDPDPTLDPDQTADRDRTSDSDQTPAFDQPLGPDPAPGPDPDPAPFDRSQDLARHPGLAGSSTTGRIAAGTPRRLVLPEEIAHEIARQARAGYPEEVCGLLLGHEDDPTTRVVEAPPVANLNRARARDRYELDPEGFLAADRAARRRGLDIVGVWHTHPDHPPRPSATDLAAAWPGWSYLIVGVRRDGTTELRSWRLAGDRFEEESAVQEAPARDPQAIENPAIDERSAEDLNGRGSPISPKGARSR